MFKEFKEFATRGNIMDMAVGVVIGGAFQKIINSLVEDVIMPCVSILTGKVDFSDMILTVGDASIKYGNFITAVVNFLIIAFSIFLAVKYVNKLNKKMEDMKFGKIDNLVSKISKKGEKKEEPAPEPTVKICPYCYSEINYKATRCPNCTSELEIKKETKAKKETKKAKAEK